MTVIDAHQHLWDPARHDFPWMADPSLKPLRRSYDVHDLEAAVPHEITATVLVQATSSIAETFELLDTATNSGRIAGVVGWCDLTADVSRTLEHGRHRGPLVGIRHQAQDEPDPNWLARPDVSRGMRRLAEAGLTYDLLVHPRELPAAVLAAKEHPGLQFVLDHCGKPDIADGNMAEWQQELRPLAALPNVACKLSGLITQASWKSWTVDDLRPATDTVLELFGPGRMMFGSDWPLCELAATYQQVLDVTRELLSALSPSEKKQLFSDTAIEIYSLADLLPLVNGI